jgi:hypothetical protein
MIEASLIYLLGAIRIPRSRTGRRRSAVHESKVLQLYPQTGTVFRVLAMTGVRHLTMADQKAFPQPGCFHPQSRENSITAKGSKRAENPSQQYS